MKLSIAILFTLLSASCFCQTIHRFTKVGNTFTYQLNSGTVTTYSTALSIDVQADTSKIRLFIDINTSIIMLRTDSLTVNGSGQLGNIYGKRLAIITILPAGDYSCLTCVPQVITDLSGLKSVQSFALTSSVNTLLASKVNVSDTPIFATKGNVRDSLLSRVTRANLMSDLKNIPVASNKLALLVGKYGLSDNLGGFYMYDTTATGTDDLVFMNTINSNLSTTGRWVRIFQKAKSYPQGTLVNNGGVKSLYISGTTDANGEITVNLTADNTSTGTAIFTEIWSIVAQPTTDASSLSNAVQSYKKTTASNLKTTTWGFFKANAVTVTLGLAYSPFSSVGAGIVVQFVIVGI